MSARRRRRGLAAGEETTRSGLADVEPAPPPSALADAVSQIQRRGSEEEDDAADEGYEEDDSADERDGLWGHVLRAAQSPAMPIIGRSGLTSAPDR
jgi:hypothetical protein